MNQILAIAYKTILKAKHDKFFIAVAVFFLIVLPSLPVMLYGDGTTEGHLRLYISYSTHFVIFFLSLLTIFMACISINEELEKKQMFMVVTKPVPRWKVVCGHWLGVVILAAGLLAVAGSINYLGTRYIFAQHEPTMEPGEKEKVRESLLSARASVTPTEPDIQELIEKQIKAYRIEHPDEEIDYEQLQKQVKQNLFYSMYCVPQRHEKQFRLTGLDKVTTETITVRFKYYTSTKPADGTITARWIFGDREKVEPVRMLSEKTPEVYHTIEIPASTIDSEGNLSITFMNYDDEYLTVIFPEKNGLEVLYRSHGFLPNFFKGYLLIFCQLIVLAALGVMFSSFLSFPVAVLMTLFVFAIGSHAVAVVQLLTASGGVQFDLIELQDKQPLTFLSLTQKLLGTIIRLFPQFDRINPVEYLSDGRAIGFRLIGRAVGDIVLLKGLLILLLGSIVFHRKEIAKVII